MQPNAPTVLWVVHPCYNPVTTPLMIMSVAVGMVVTTLPHFKNRIPWQTAGGSFRVAFNPSFVGCVVTAYQKPRRFSHMMPRQNVYTKQT